MDPMAFEPASTLRLWAQVCRLGLESQYVIAMRVSGIMGVVPHAATENLRMVTEKEDAARESIDAALSHVASGARADEIIAAALRPYSTRTCANAQRLSRAH